MKRYSAQIALLIALAISLGVSSASKSIDSYVMAVLVGIGINIVLGVSLNLVNGHTGQFSLGHAAFMAVGAYAAAIFTIQGGAKFTAMLGGPGLFANGVCFLLALLIGGICAAICGWLIGMPSLRLKGDYLAIVTLGFNEIIRVILQNTDGEGIFGGPLGLKGIPTRTTFFWTFASAAICIYVVAAMVNSTYGRGFLAVRDDEIASGSMGINTTRYKVTAFVVGSFFAGIAGGLYAHFKNTIDPDGFNFMRSFDVVVIVILGGMGSTPGVVLSAIVLSLLNEKLREFEQYRMIVFSLLLIVMMLVRPQGLLPSVRLPKKWRKSA